MLRGRADHDPLSPREQAVVRAEWSERIRGRIEALDVEERFSSQGRSFKEADE